MNAGKVDEQVEQFSSIMQEGMRRFIPRKRPRNSKFPAWFSGELRVALKHKKRAHRKARRTNSESWQQQFVYYRSLCKVLYKRDRLLYISAVENDATRSSRCFWQYVRFRSGTKSREHISLLDEKGNDIASVADALLSTSVQYLEPIPSPAPANCLLQISVSPLYPKKTFSRHSNS